MRAFRNCGLVFRWLGVRWPRESDENRCTSAKAWRHTLTCQCTCTLALHGTWLPRRGDAVQRRLMRTAAAARRTQRVEPSKRITQPGYLVQLSVFTRYFSEHSLDHRESSNGGIAWQCTYGSDPTGPQALHHGTNIAEQASGHVSGTICPKDAAGQSCSASRPKSARLPVHDVGTGAAPTAAAVHPDFPEQSMQLYDDTCKSAMLSPTGQKITTITPSAPRPPSN